MNPSPIKKNESYKVAYKNNKIEQVKDSKSQFPRRPRTIVRSIPYWDDSESQTDADENDHLCFYFDKGEVMYSHLLEWLGSMQR